MKKMISNLYLLIVLILLLLAAYGILQSGPLQAFGLLGIVGVVWMICCVIGYKNPQWTWYGVLLFLLSWGVFPLMKFVSKYTLPWSADQLLSTIDQKLWQGQILAAYFHYEAYPVLADVISLSYFFFYFLVLGSVIYFAVRRSQHIGMVYFNAIILLYLIGFIGYICLPAMGPAFTSLPQHGGGGAITQWVTNSVNQGITGMDVFPSLHTAISIFIVGYFYQIGHKTLSIVLLPVVLGTIFATIFLRYHYGIDVIVGLILGFVILGLSRSWLKQRSVID